MSGTSLLIDGSPSCPDTNDYKIRFRMAQVAEVSMMIGEMQNGKHPQYHPEVYRQFGVERR